MSASLFHWVGRFTRAVRVAGSLAVATSAGVLHAQQTAPRPPPSVGEKTSEALAKLKPLQDAKDWSGLLAVLDAIPAVKPGSYDEAVILDTKARIFGVMEQASKALAPWERALQISDEHGYFPERQTLEIVLYLAQLHAVEAFNQKAQEQQVHLAKSAEFYRRYFEKITAPSADVLMTYATVLFQKAIADPNNPDRSLLREARGVIDRALKLSIRPKDTFYQLQIALLQQENDLVGASELIELLVNQKPDKNDYWQSLVGIYRRLSDEAKDTHPALSRQYLVRAIVTIERAQGLGFLNTPADKLHLCSLYLTANQFTKGTAMLYAGMKSGAIESTPTNWRLLGRFYQEANQREQALAVLEEAIARFPQNGEIEMQIAELDYVMEKNADALRHAKAAVDKGNFETTKPFSVHYLIAYTAYDLGQLEEAQQAIAAAEKYPEEVGRNAQFTQLKSAVNDAIADRERKRSGKSGG